MWVAYRKLHKLWLIYLFITFFGIFILFYCTKLLVDKSAYINQHKYQFRNDRKTRGKNVNVIVGHYIGTGNLFGNLSEDSMNANNFSPIAGEGDNGKPVIVPAKDILRMQQLFQVNRFNLVASDRIPLNRTIPDVRKKKCLSKSYSSKLPTTSVIIVFHNEAWSVLLRTIWSVINRSPKKYLSEILLIDDASERDFLKTALEDYVMSLPIPTKIFRLSKRSGLVAARLLGADNAIGDTLTFLDAHCECSPGWLEPLLARVKEDRRKVVCPVIDIISDDNFSYIKSFEFHSGAFNWQLHFRWYTLSHSELQRKNDITEPFKTPAMAGGLFTIDREYFYEVGSYDDQMKIWGGDNLEMSFRIWQCGGEVEIIPCSHVGHLFRKSSPYTFPGGVNEVLNTNLARLAKVWMDDWSNFFVKYNRIERNITDHLDIESRLQLRHHLDCKPFKWYLEEIWPQNFFPADDRLFGKLILANEKSKFFKKYRNLLKSYRFEADENWENLIGFLNENRDKFDLRELTRGPSNDIFCLTKPHNSKSINQLHVQPVLRRCHNDTTILDQLFVAKDDGMIMSDEGVCLDCPEFNGNLLDLTKARMFTCSAASKRQHWWYSVKTQQIKHLETDYCLEGTQSLRHVFSNRLSETNEGFDVFIRPCSTNALQKWVLLPLEWK